IFSILLVVGIYFITYQNWMRQKKLTAITSDFINSITHEFNTPIATILVANQSLENSVLMDDKVKSRDLIAVIKRQSIRLKNLINQSLTISQLSSINLDKARYYLPSVLLELLEDYSLKLEDNVSIIPDIQHDVSELDLNKFLFTTMIYNLLDNGIKYNESSEKIIQVKVYQQDNDVFIHIEDNGVGVNLESLKHIFKKFFRGKQRVEEGGLGLGLFYVQQVVNLHDWDLSVASEIGKGTKFIIKINTRR
ncbi:MAG TPA: HAMP domain-containing sensor histidine kinase, partial [Sphingobacterium bovisgrunnientis]|nr:HAMP domain-containing sensor histidine kinase [Sphingobacterium bovisgrunnientis]